MSLFAYDFYIQEYDLGTVSAERYSRMLFALPKLVLRTKPICAHAYVLFQQVSEASRSLIPKPINVIAGLFIFMALFPIAKMRIID